MYTRLCTVPLAEVGRIHNFLRKCGLLPLTRSLSAHTPKVGGGQRYSIELPDDEIEKGRKILADHRGI
jgi:hypothetical protein